jgi:DNA-directed RNA polymerase subunit H (RpoH/RPB5)/galactitol-specific phosphotransferase system IIB component
MSSTNKIISIYKSRTTIIELLNKQGYETEEYENFNINEIDAMFVTGQLDMIVSQKKINENLQPPTKKVYIKYYLDSKQLRTPVLDDIVEDLFTSVNGDNVGSSTTGNTLDTTLSKKDTLVIIVENEPNDSIMSKVEYLYDKEGIFIVIFNIRRLQFNILNHRLVPPIHILTVEEKEAFMTKYNINSTGKIPEIGRFDPQAQAVFLRPGDICKFERESLSALKYDYYRVCV